MPQCPFVLDKRGIFEYSFILLATEVIKSQLSCVFTTVSQTGKFCSRPQFVRSNIPINKGKSSRQ